jgi:hypothetical protein
MGATRNDAHRFNHPKDPTKGGTWFGDRGRRLCDWSWDATTKTLKVTCGKHSKRIDLSNTGEQSLTPEELRDRLAQLALEIAQRIVEEGKGGGTTSSRHL